MRFAFMMCCLFPDQAPEGEYPIFFMMNRLPNIIIDDIETFNAKHGLISACEEKGNIFVYGSVLKVRRWE